jgi:hypothetical protein
VRIRYAYEFGIVNAENQMTSVLWKNYTKLWIGFQLERVAFSFSVSLLLLLLLRFFFFQDLIEIHLDSIWVIKMNLDSWCICKKLFKNSRWLWIDLHFKLCWELYGPWDLAILCSINIWLSPKFVIFKSIARRVLNLPDALFWSWRPFFFFFFFCCQIKFCFLGWAWSVSVGCFL